MLSLTRLIIILTGVVVVGSLIDAGYCYYSSKCTGSGYRREKYHKKCGAFGWKRCTRYRQRLYYFTKYCQQRRCCSGYIGSTCSQAICQGKTTCPNGGKCIRPNYCSCRTGYRSPDCNDINECSSNNGGCNHQCTNTHGSFRCSCKGGFTLQSNRRACVDINECSSNNGGCNQICNNVPGSYFCTCKNGYKLGTDKRTCSDINECLVKNGGCNHFCTNVPGSYSCHCKPGFSLQSDKKTCSDTNECLTNNGGCQQVCINEHSSYHCECKTGYKLGTDGKSCSDIDECKGSSRCSQDCTNTDGSYVCSCRPGYYLASDGALCIDIDDCVGAICQNGGTCIDQLMSYSCKCLSGFEGKHCEQDINECLFVNGGCDDTCINTAGSYHCQCSNGGVLDNNGFSCIGQNTSAGNSSEATVFEKRRIARRLLPRGCAFIELTSCSGSSSSLKILLSSTSDWYQLNSNSSILYTFGIVFMEVDRLSLPMSISGMLVTRTTSSFDIILGSLKFTEHNGRKLTDMHHGSCMSFDITPKDIHDFITSGSFLSSFFENLYNSLPDWLRFSKSGTGLLAVTDLKTELIYGRDMDSIHECTGAPVQTDHLYNVFHFGTEFAASIYGNQVRLPAPLRGNKICFIVDICQNYGGTVYLMLPPESRDLLDNFKFFKSYRETYGLHIRPRGIGLSVNKEINVHYKSKTIRLWNGDGFSQYSVFPSASVWLNSDIKMDYDPNDWLNVNVDGNAELFLAVPNLSKLLTGIFVDEWNGWIDFNRFRATPTLQFRLLNKDVVLKFNDLVTASVEAYFSIGGSSKRLWCGDNANPQGAFVSFMVGLNPFRNIPILQDWIFDANVRIHAFFATNPDTDPSIDLRKDIIDFRYVINTFEGMVNYLMTHTVGELSNSTINLIRNLQNITKSFVQKLEDLSNNILNFRHIIDIVTETWKLYTREFKKTAQEIKDELEFAQSVIAKNVSDLIEEQHTQIGRNIDKIVTKIKDQIFSVVNKYTGFGLKFTTSIKIVGLEFSLVDVELVYSVDQIGQCSKYKKVYELLKGEKAAKILARNTVRQRLGYFLKIEASQYISIAFSISEFKFVVHLHAHVSVLGLRVSSDLLISNYELRVVIEGNIWNVFLARVELSAQTNHKWNELRFRAVGELLARSSSSGSDFQGSYLDGLRLLARETADKANKRFEEAVNKLSAAQRVLDKAIKKLSSAQAKVRSFNAAFDSAIRSMDRAKQKLEKAKVPFEKALEKLRRAQRKVDNLCRIKSCKKICVPGVKMKMCKKGWVRYPCLRKSGCLFRIPNPVCELANLACRGVRALAYVALEAAKIFVRVPMLAFDAAKALVSAAQVIVDKSRVVLKVAEGVLELAKLGLHAAKGTIELAKAAVNGVKFIVGAALRVFELIIKYGLQNLLDVKNCRFEIELTTFDKASFEVSCDVEAFKTGWHTFKFEFDFRHPINSMWNMAKSTITTLLDIVKSIFKLRRKREVSQTTPSNLLLPTTKLFDTVSNATNTENNITIQLENKQHDRIQFFKENCAFFQNIYLFLSESIETLISMTNDSFSTLNDANNIKSTLTEFETNMTTTNMTADALGISTEYAFQDYNITEDELNTVIQKIKISDDPLLKEIAETNRFAKDIIDDEIANVQDVSVIEFWILGIENSTEEYFDESECVGFEDCVSYAYDTLKDLFIDSEMQHSDRNRNLTGLLEYKFKQLLRNSSTSITDAYTLSTEILDQLHQLNESNLFCSEPPTVTTELQNKTIGIGSTLQFTCNAFGDPHPDIRWYHNDSVIRNESSTNLVRKNVTMADGGKYICQAGNIVTNVSSNDAFVTVEDADDCIGVTCGNGGTCVDQFRSYYCKCRTGFKGRHCEKAPEIKCSGLWGFYPNPFDCAGFVHCSWGFPNIIPCPKNTIWSQEYLGCVLGKCK